MKKKKTVSIMAAALAVILLSLGISTGVRICKKQSTITLYKTIWNIALPEHIKETYRNVDLGFTGDGSRYLVFQTAEVPDAFLSGLSKGRNEDFENCVNQITSKWLQIPEEKRPDWEQEYQWKFIEKENTPDYLCIIYYPAMNQLVLASVEI